MTGSDDWLFDDRVQELLAEWIERAEQGESISVEILCGDDPKLTEQLATAIEQLKRTDWMLGTTVAQEDFQNEIEPDDVETVIGLCQTLATEVLMRRVEALEILSVEKVNEIRAAQTSHDSADLARRLLDFGLTPFQLRRLIEDRGDELLLNDYLILEPVGEGGMGRVYTAVQRTMNRIVAVKVLSPRILDTEHAVRRFRREVQTVARLNHPHIVSAHDAGSVADRHYLVMEYVDGSDLSTRIRRDGPLNVRRAVEYILQAAKALEYSHQQGVIHRDVKPSNLFVDADEIVKILDLGLARVETSVAADVSPSISELTASGQVMGTVDYLAPEQAIDSRNADERSDIYSLGCTLYSLLNGRALFERESVVNRLLAHQSDVIPRLTAEHAEIPDALNTIFQKMVAKDPVHRYQTMTEVITDLEALGQGSYVGPLTAARSPLRQRFGKKFWPAVAGVVVLFAVLGVIATIQFGGIRLTVDSGSRSEPADVPTDRPPALAVVPFGAERARALQQQWAAHLGIPVEYQNSIGMRFRLIPPGQFVMGTSLERMEELLREAPNTFREETIRSEFPAHRVRITRPHYIAVHETTQRQFQLVTRRNPSYFSPRAKGAKAVDGVWSADFPVDSVNWYEAAMFCNMLSDHDGLSRAYQIEGAEVAETPGIGYRLPTEAQFEFAARAGSAGEYCFSHEGRLEDYAWFETNSGNRTHSVGALAPNAFGLFDVHGNVFEWCWDWFDVSYYGLSPHSDPHGPPTRERRLLRGGGFQESMEFNRLTSKDPHNPAIQFHFSGFRVLLPIDAVDVK